MTSTAVGRREIIALLCFLLLLGGALPAMAAAPAGTIEGQTKDAQGRPLPGVQLSLRNAAGRVAKEATSRADGRYRFAGVAAGDYAISGAKSGFAAATAAVVVRSGERVSADLTLAAVAAGAPAELGEVNVVARRLEAARAAIEPQIGRLGLHGDEPGDRGAARRRKQHAQPGPAAGPGGQPGCRGGGRHSHPQRDAAGGVPDQRDPAARRVELFRPGPQPALCQLLQPDHRRAAGAIRAEHHRHHRYPDQERAVRARRLGHDVWRQLSDAAAELRIRRLGRRLQLLRQRRFPQHQPRHRRGDPGADPDPRFLDAGARLCLSQQGHRCREPGDCDRRAVRRPLRDPEQSVRTPVPRNDLLRRHPGHRLQPFAARRAARRSRRDRRPLLSPFRTRGRFPGLGLRQIQRARLPPRPDARRPRLQRHFPERRPDELRRRRANRCQRQDRLGPHAALRHARGRRALHLQYRLVGADPGRQQRLRPDLRQHAGNLVPDRDRRQPWPGRLVLRRLAAGRVAGPAEADRQLRSSLRRRPPTSPSATSSARASMRYGRRPRRRSCTPATRASSRRRRSSRGRRKIWPSSTTSTIPG